MTFLEVTGAISITLVVMLGGAYLTIRVVKLSETHMNGLSGAVQDWLHMNGLNEAVRGWFTRTKKAPEPTPGVPREDPVPWRLASSGHTHMVSGTIAPVVDIEPTASPRRLTVRWDPTSLTNAEDDSLIRLLHDYQDLVALRVAGQSIRGFSSKNATLDSLLARGAIRFQVYSLMKDRDIGTAPIEGWVTTMSQLLSRELLFDTQSDGRLTLVQAPPPQPPQPPPSRFNREDIV